MTLGQTAKLQKGAEDGAEGRKRAGKGGKGRTVSGHGCGSRERLLKPGLDRRGTNLREDCLGKWADAGN